MCVRTLARPALTHTTTTTTTYNNNNNNSNNNSNNNNNNNNNNNSKTTRDPSPPSPVTTPWEVWWGVRWVCEWGLVCRTWMAACNACAQGWVCVL